MNPSRLAWLLIFLVSSSDVRVAAAPQLVVGITPERIEEAIQLAADEKVSRKFLDAYVLQSRTGWGNGPLIGTFSTPFARVLQAALAARKQGKPFTAGDVAPEIVAPELHVIATSQEAGLDATNIASVQSVAVTRRGNTSASDAVQPIRTIELSKDYQSLYGAAFPRPGIVAVFPLTVVAADHEIHVVFDRMAKGSSASAMCKDCAVPFPINRIR